MYIGIDIGGTKCAVTKGDANGNILKKIKFPTTDKENTLKAIFDAVEQMGQADAIGVSCGGPLDSKKGIIMSPPNLPGWDDVPIVKMLTEKFNIPAFLQNDANACALAEWQFGAGEGCENMVFFTFGTGLGAGIILNGKLYEGTNGMAGEAGHIRLADNGPVGYGKEGSFEGFCSGGGIKQLANGKDAKTLAEAARKGDKEAIEIFETCGEYLGKGLSIIIDIINPERIVLGSIFERCSDLLVPSMEKELQKEALSLSREVCTILPAALGDEVGDYAALAVAVEGVKTNGFYNRYPCLSALKENIEKTIDVFEKCYENSGTILLCGNGGSASDCSHIAGELLKGFMSKRPLSCEDKKSFGEREDVAQKLQNGIPAISLPDQTGVLTAFCNDVDPALMYAQLVWAYAKKEDVLLCISTSGNSENVYNAAVTAKAKGITVIGLAGKNKCRLDDIADLVLHVPETETYKVQELHLPVYHYICAELERKLFREE